MRTAAFARVFEAIPTDTFAPNILISGAASMLGLRVHRIEVMQQPRQTGEVSIRKWKLLAAAIRAFSQTLRARGRIRGLRAAA
jgi:hypothetical protein